ncbi:DUF6714 family protein [Microcoleus sp. B9-D4]|uniref:DUF6714 family protein n=1 Tax=Microcoleus sp. B9-D4 TaxID=2818711 RepID=UPI002FD35950
MSERQQQLLDTIARAFRGVELGDGVSLHETVLIDLYEGPEARQEARLLDEKHDWRKLVGDPALVQVTGSPLSFYDATGLRFHLPAYLSLAVTDFDHEDAADVLGGLMFTLTNLCEYNLERLSILDSPQRQCVKDVLVYLRDEFYLRDEYEYELESLELDQAIGGYWNSEPTVERPA